MLTRLLVPAFTIVWSMGLTMHVGAQPPSAASSADAAPVRPAADERASYDAAGRRDPFISLASSGSTLTDAANRPAGVRGLLISELSLRGIVQTQQRLLATVSGPDKRTFTIANGDQLLDGTVKVISTDAVVFLQQVNDPLSPITQREIRKTLRSTEETR